MAEGEIEEFGAFSSGSYGPTRVGGHWQRAKTWSTDTDGTAAKKILRGFVKKNKKN